LSIVAARELGRYLAEVHGIKPVTRSEVVPVPNREPTGEGQDDEPTEFDVLLDGCEAARRVGVIRVVRELTGMGLKDVEDLVDGAPRVLKERVPKADAEQLKAQLEAVGAKVAIRPCAAT
jgi:large subunit ribosomal protein L7/L12